MNARRALATLALAAASAALPGLCAAEAHAVTIEGMKFQPETITVRRGDTIAWRNKDVVPHTVTSAGKFDSGQVDANAGWSWKPTQAGTFEYVCTYHPGMKGVVIVE